MRKLAVYFHREFVGELVQETDGKLKFTYLSEWLNNPNAIPLSYSLPLSATPFDHKLCQGFFGGLLPESLQRELIAKNLGISPRNDFAMLEKIGGECAGAITFIPAGEKLNNTHYHYQTLKDKELAEILRVLPRRPLLLGMEGIRLSLAGVQDKIAVKVAQGQIALPLEGAPSTHILKPAIDHFADIVYNEAFCLQLAEKIGLSVAKAAIHTVEEINYLLIERYDRIVKNDGTIERLHQEDFCQALGISSVMKYQNEGGPSLKQCFKLLREVSTTPALDLRTFLDAVIFNFIIGNHDAHGKNFSLLYQRKQIRLSPLYDLVSTIYYPELSTKMAMKIGSKYQSQEVLPRHFEQMAEEVGLAIPLVRGRVSELIHNVNTTLKEWEIKNPTIINIAGSIERRVAKLIKTFG
ncbi:MAG: type II toxin-antitoxin system HipA family toxin [Proteobacteria bacterium]|nr:type II toxin-antitoxin system HipA family toxin [Pseudomonadota bacterium]